MSKKTYNFDKKVMYVGNGCKTLTSYNKYACQFIYNNFYWENNIKVVNDFKKANMIRLINDNGRVITVDKANFTITF